MTKLISHYTFPPTRLTPRFYHTSPVSSSVSHRAKHSNCICQMLNGDARSLRLTLYIDGGIQMGRHRSWRFKHLTGNVWVQV